MTKPQWLIDYEARTIDEKIADKLTDAGMDYDRALTWVREAMAQAWDDGYIEGRADEHDSIAGADHDATPNPYQPKKVN